MSHSPQNNDPVDIKVSLRRKVVIVPAQPPGRGSEWMGREMSAVLSDPNQTVFIFGSTASILDRI